MDNGRYSLNLAKHTVLQTIHQLSEKNALPLLVAIDGGSGSGKSTLAEMIAKELDAAVISGDDFYAAYIPNAEWGRKTALEKVAQGIDWRRIRQEAVQPLLNGQKAIWQPFDFLNPNPDGSYPLCQKSKSCEPADIILLEGAYSCRPELADLIDLKILVNTSVEKRHTRLDEREDAEFLVEWHARWDEAEELYFTDIMPPSAFDLVVHN